MGPPFRWVPMVLRTTMFPANRQEVPHPWMCRKWRRLCCRRCSSPTPHVWLVIALHHPRGFLFRRKPPLRRELIDEVRQILTEAFEQIVAVHAGLPGECVELVISEGLLQIGRRNLLVWSTTDPGLRPSALSVVLQIVDQATEAAAQHGARSSAAQ